MLLVIAPIGGVALLYTARRPLLAVVAMIVVEVTNLSGVLEHHGKVPVFQASLLLGVLAIAFALRDPYIRGRINRWTGICAALLAIYLATQTIAVIGSVDMTASIASLRRMTLDCVFVMLVLVLLQLTQRPWVAAAAVVIPFAVLSLLTIVDQFVFNGTMTFGGFSTVTTASGVEITTLRYGGPLPDSNFWGRHLVMALPLAAALLTRALRSRQRVAVAGWVAAVTVLLAGIYLTQSRGTFLAAGAGILVWFVASDRSIRRRGLTLLPLTAVLFALPGVGNRLLGALDDVTKAQVSVNVDPSVLGRLAAQQEAWMMFQQRPYFGFGPGTFPGEVINFAGRVSLAVREPTNAPHNLYAELAAESGVTGLLGWALLVMGFLIMAGLGTVARSHERVLGAAVCAAIVAWLVASIGLHLAYFRTFGVLLAFAGALAPAWPIPVQAVRRAVRAVAVWSVAGSVGLSAAWLYFVFNSAPAVTANQRVTLLPSGPVDGFYAYALDIRSRIELLPTFAVLLADPTSPVELTADPVRGVAMFSVTARDAETARDKIQAAVAHAEAELHSSIGYQQYVLAPVGSMRVAQSRSHSPLVPVVAAGIAGASTVVVGLLLFQVIPSRRASYPEVAVKPELASL